MAGVIRFRPLGVHSGDIMTQTMRKIIFRIGNETIPSLSFFFLNLVVLRFYLIDIFPCLFNTLSKSGHFFTPSLTIS